MAKKFTRAEFYDLVWSKPMRRLAEDLGVSDVALHKICKKHNIPKPPQGWWARKEAGREQEQTPLPEREEGGAELIIVSGSSVRDEPESIAASRQKATETAATFDAGASTEVHSLVKATIDQLQKATPNSQGLVSVRKAGLIDITIAPASIERAGIALHRIAAAAAAHGLSLASGENAAEWADDEVSIPFKVREGLRRTKHEPTPQELAKEDKERKRRERLWGYSESGAETSRSLFRNWPEYDYHPDGKLAFELDCYIRSAANLRKSYKDGKKQRLENLANEIGIALAVIVSAKREDNRRAEEERRQAQERERRRNEAKRLEYIEERRRKVLESVLERVRRREQLREFEAEIREDLGNSPGPRSTKFAAWLDQELTKAEKAASVEGLEQLFSAESVFGDDDDKGFYPSRYGW